MRIGSAARGRHDPLDTYGTDYNAEDGKTCSGNITAQGANALKLEGCALGGLICKGQTWTRVK